MTKKQNTTDVLKLLDCSDSDDGLDDEKYKYSDDLITEGEDEGVADDSLDHNE